MKQLTATNNQFTLEESLMEKVFEASGYKLTIVTPNDSEPHFMGREIADALGYSKPSNLAQHLQSKKFKTLVLNKYNGLPNLKNQLPSIGKYVSQLSLIPSSSLQEYLTLHAKKSIAKDLGKKLYAVLASGKASVEVVEEEKNPVLELLNTELESNEFGSKFNTWYKEKINKCSYFWRWDEKNQLYNWQKSLIGLRMTLGSRFLKVAGKNSAKNVLKKQGASSKLTKSNRTIARSFDPASSDQMLFLPILTTKSTSIQFAERKDSSSCINNFCLI